MQGTEMTSFSNKFEVVRVKSMTVHDVTRVEVRIEGEFSLPPVTEQIERDFGRILSQRPRLVVLDLSGLTFLSSLGLGVLMRFRKDIARHGGQIRIASVTPRVREMFVHARLDGVFHFVDSSELIPA